MSDTKKNFRVLLLLFFGVLLAALDLSMVGPAIPAIEKSMSLQERDLSRIFTIYLLFYLFGIPFMSKLSDIYGRRIIYIISLTVFGVGAGLVAFSHNITFLLIGRAVQGFGSSGIFPVAAAIIGDVFPAEKRGRALGILGGVYGIAFITGPLIAGSILHFFSWNALFLINLPATAVIIIFATMLLPGKPQSDKPLIKWPGIIMLVAILSCFTIGLENIEVTNLGASFFSWQVLPLLVIVTVFTPLLIKYELKQKDSFITVEFFRSNQLRLVGIIAFGLGLFQSCIVFLPKMAVELFSVTPAKASFMLLPLVLSTAIVPLVMGRLLDVIGSKIVIIFGLIFAVISLFMFSLLPSGIPYFYAAEAGLGIGLAIRSSLKYIVLNEVGVKVRTVSLGMLIILISVGQIAGATLIGVLISGISKESEGFHNAFLLLTISTIVILVCSFLLKTREIEILKIRDT